MSFHHRGAPPPGELAQAQFVIGVLLGKHDPQLLDAYLQTLDPGLLADVVIANMARLPPAAPPDDGGGSSAGGLTGLLQVCTCFGNRLTTSDWAVGPVHAQAGVAQTKTGVGHPAFAAARAGPDCVNLHT